MTWAATRVTSAHKGDFKIYVYDPNIPNKTRTLIVDEENKKFKYAENGSHYWRTYFVDEKWKAKRPPTIAQIEREFLVTMETGEDDLRGGNDNINLFLKTGPGPEIPFRNVNKGKRWIMGSTQTVAVSLPAGVSPDSVTGLRLQHTGINGNPTRDNWDLRIIRVETGDADGKSTLFSRGGTPLHRFTGSSRSASWDFASIAAQNQLMFYFLTGSDDLRGGNDNVNAFILLTGGREHPIYNNNKRRKWENGAQINVALPLPRGVSHSNIVGVRLETIFRGGFRGDNWNLAYLSLKTREGGREHSIIAKGNTNGSTLHRFTSDARKKSWMRDR